MATKISGSTLVKESCCNCGIEFGMPLDFYHAAKADNNKFFHCPNGHSQHYTESETTRLKRQLDEANRMTTVIASKAERLLKECNHLGVQLKSTKTRMRNLKTRIANGICPCCNRQFGNLRRHMTHQHPGYKPETSEQS